MRYWGRNIKIAGDWIMDSPNQNDDNARTNPDAARFEEETQTILRNISNNPVGKVVLDAFDSAANDVTIRPLARAAIRKQSSRPIFVDKARETDRGSPSAPGPGSGVTIWFYRGGVNVHGHFYRSDDSLLHESFHALRQVRGRWRAVPMPGWDNREEMYASMVTNIYASRGSRNADMRSTHGAAFVPMQLTPEQFRQQFFNEILEFRSSMFDIYSSIAALQVNWNPLAVFESRFWIR